jgi:hypothetical protein
MLSLSFEDEQTGFQAIASTIAAGKVLRFFKLISINTPGGK